MPKTKEATTETMPETIDKFVIESRVKAYLHDKGVNCGADGMDGVHVAVKELLDRAAARVLANGRKNTKPFDA